MSKIRFRSSTSMSHYLHKTKQKVIEYDELKLQELVLQSKQNESEFSVLVYKIRDSKDLCRQIELRCNDINETEKDTIISFFSIL